MMIFDDLEAEVGLHNSTAITEQAGPVDHLHNHIHINFCKIMTIIIMMMVDNVGTEGVLHAAAALDTVRTGWIILSTAQLY